MPCATKACAAIAALVLLAVSGAAACSPQLGLAGWSDPGDDAGVDGLVPQVPPEGMRSRVAERLPRAVHLSWQGDPATALTFAWQTGTVPGYAPKVWIVPASLCEETDAGVEMPFAAAYTAAGAGVEYESGDQTRIEWVVQATGLAPDTEYLYRVGTWSAFDEGAGELVGASLSTVRAIRTAPAAGAAAPFSFVVAGDSHGGLEDLALHLADIAALPAAFWLLSGDMNNSNAQAQWDAWFDVYAPVTESTVVMPVRGNHEATGAAYLAQFALPAEPALAPELAELAWSFDYANVHVVGLDSLTVANVEALAPWLAADLAAAAADPDVLWKVVLFHHPAYSASAHGCTARVLEHWAPLFDLYGVDLVFSGHDHDYERTVPISGGAAAAPGAGVTYIVNGGFFTSLYPAGTDWWTAFSASVDSYVTVEVDGGELHLVARRAADQTVLDEITLTK